MRYYVSISEILLPSNIILSPTAYGYPIPCLFHRRGALTPRGFVGKVEGNPSWRISHGRTTPPTPPMMDGWPDGPHNRSGITPCVRSGATGRIPTRCFAAGSFI
jgi:hypothetical protein